MKIIAVMNQKGGIGKTMTAAAIAYIMGEEKGKKVLICDADQHGNISLLYDRFDPEGQGMSELLENHQAAGGAYSTTDLIQTTPYGNIDIIPANGYLMRTNMTLLQEEAELEEIVKMVGMDALSPSDRLKMEAARSIREDFLHQNSFHEVDTYTSLKKQHMMMVLVNEFFDRATDALKDGASLQKLISMPVREQIGRFKYVTEDKLDEEFKQVDETLSAQIAAAFVKEEG